MELMTRQQTADFLKVSLSTLWKFQKRADFPKAIKFSYKKVCFKKEDITNWVNNQI